MAMAHSMSKLLPAITSADCTLAALEIDSSGDSYEECSWLPEPFHYQTRNYAADVTEISSIQLRVTANSGTSTVTVEGVAHDQSTLATVQLGDALSAKLVRIVVSSSGGKACEYTLSVYREAGSTCAPTNAATVEPSSSRRVGGTLSQLYTGDIPRRALPTGIREDTAGQSGRRLADQLPGAGQVGGTGSVGGTGDCVATRPELCLFDVFCAHSCLVPLVCFVLHSQQLASCFVCSGVLTATQPAASVMPCVLWCAYCYTGTLSCLWIGAGASDDAWCNSNCNHTPPNCPAASCLCGSPTDSPTDSSTDSPTDSGASTGTPSLSLCS